MLDHVLKHLGEFWVLQVIATWMFFCLCWVEGLLTRAKPPYRPTPELVTDMFYWLMSPTMRVVGRATSGALSLWLLAFVGIQADLMQGYGPVSRQPVWLQGLELLVLMDLMSYLCHRMFHAVPWLWRFHAIHHSAHFVRWSTTGRVHPVNEVINFAVVMVPFVLVGFSMKVGLFILPIATLYAIFVHGQFSWDFGPLRRIFVSPRFHRWHHTHSSEGGNSNFANLFAFWDRMFGTYYLPEGRHPSRFGVDDDDVPESYLAHLVYPFRRPSREAEGGAPTPAPVREQRAPRTCDRAPTVARDVYPPLL